MCENIIIGRTITKIVNETDSYITIRIVKSFKTEADLAPNYIFLGLPENNYPKTEIISIKKMKPNLKYKKTGNNYFEWTNIQKHQNLYVATLKINPYLMKITLHEEITLKIYYPESKRIFRIANPNEKSFYLKKLSIGILQRIGFIKINLVKERFHYSTKVNGLASKFLLMV